jgi:hypothetical protein
MDIEGSTSQDASMDDGERILVLTARGDQLASCWIHNVCEVLYCEYDGITPLLNPHQPYENEPSSRGEPTSPLYTPFTKLFERAQEDEYGTEENWRIIHEAAARVVLSHRGDVVSVYRDVLYERFRTHLDCVYENAKVSESRDAVCVHVRLGDVEHLTYSKDFGECAGEVVSFFDWAKRAKDIRLLSYYLGRTGEIPDLSCRPAENTWNWGQTSVDLNQLKAVMQLAERSGSPIHIITHKANDLLKSVAAEFGARVFDGESEIESVARMVICKELYIANSYMGFVAGVLRGSGDVYYPRNAMFAVFGLGSKHDASGWHPMDLEDMPRRKRKPMHIMDTGNGAARRRYSDADTPSDGSESSGS